MVCMFLSSISVGTLVGQYIEKQEKIFKWLLFTQV